MATLFMRLSGPMQSWGTRSSFDERDSEMEPSLSGVLGLVAAAMGIDRSDWQSLEPLTHLRMGVRVDKPGILRRDYQTAQMFDPDKPKKEPDTMPTVRYYLSDACFLVGLEGDKKLLSKIEEALRAPFYPLYLGRKSYVPSSGVFIPVTDQTPEGGMSAKKLETALSEFPYLPALDSEDDQNDDPPDFYRYIVESKTNEGSLRMDVPVSSFIERKYAGRFVMSSVKAKGEKL